MQGMGGRSFGSPLIPSPHHYMFLLATKLSFRPLTKPRSDCLDWIGLQIRSDSGSARIELAIGLKFKVTVKVIACWLLYDCEELS